MARSDANLEFNTFVGGILTEANPINFPPNFSLDEENFVLEHSGTRRRRRALAIQDQSTSTTIQHQQEVGLWLGSGSFVWKNDKIVTWSNGHVSTFDISSSGSIEATEVSIHTDTKAIYNVSPFRDHLVVCVAGSKSFTRLDGSTSDLPLPEFLIYNDLGDLLATNYIQVRDYTSLDDSLELNERPTTLTNEHDYNTLNQGWTTTNSDQFFTDTATYPSNSDNMNTGLDEATSVFTSSWVDIANSGKAKTLGGRAILDFFRPKDSRESFLFEQRGSTAGTLGSESTLAADNPVAEMTEFIGRLFYLLNIKTSPTNIPACYLAYSPIEIDLTRIADCYRANDPTARDFNESLATDGGFLDISSVGEGYTMSSIKDRLFIFGSNGVFELVSASATNDPAAFQLRKVTNETLIDSSQRHYGYTGRSVVLAGDSLYYWSNSGILCLRHDSSSGLYVSINLTSSTIQDLYKRIRYPYKKRATGFYVPLDQTIHFLYNNNSEANPPTSSEDPDYYTQELIYDIKLNAWYKNTFYTPDFGEGALPDDSNFIIDGFVRTDLGLDSYVDIGVDSNVAYLVTKRLEGVNQDIHFATYTSDDTFTDYVGTLTPGERASFLQTGYINIGDSQRDKQVAYIVPSFIRTETGFTDDGNGNLSAIGESSCTLTAWWDYADDESSPKVNPPQEVYRLNRNYIPEDANDTFNYGQSVITTKNRLSGRGRALSLRFESSEGKDCRLLGWGMDMGTTRRV